MVSPRALLLVSSLLFIASVLNDPPWKFYSPSQRVLNSGEPAHVAASLLEDGTFANPFGVLRTGPTAHLAPAFPFVQFVVLRMFGTGAAGWLAIRCLSAVALGLQFALLPYFGRFLGYSPWTGVLASVFGLIVKPAREELWEAHLAGLAALILTVLFCRWATGTRTRALTFAIGTLGGFAFLLQPVFALVYVVWLIGVRAPVRLWIFPAIFCAPWAIRNFIEVRALGLRDNLGIEMYVSYNDCAPYGIRESEQQSCFTSLHPNTNLEEANGVLSLGESEYNRDRLRRAVTWMASHPAGTAHLILQRFWFFWFPSDEGWEGYRTQRKRLFVLHAMTLVSLAGLLLMLRRTPATGRVLALWLTLFPLIYYVVQFETRYRYPILWITWISAAYFLTEIKKITLAKPAMA